MDKNSLEETKKLNEQSRANKGSSTYQNTDMNSMSNRSDMASMSNRSDMASMSNMSNMTSVSNMTSGTNDATLEETKQLNARSRANKGTTKR